MEQINVKINLKKSMRFIDDIPCVNILQTLILSNDNYNFPTDGQKIFYISY